MNDGNVRVRYSYSGAGWSVRTINPAKAEPKKDPRRVRLFALILGGAAIVCILAGVTVFSQRAPQPQGRPLGREDVEPIVVSPVPAPFAPAEPSAPAAPLVTVPQPVEEAVHPLPPPMSRGAESAETQSGDAIERAVQPAHVTGGQVARIWLTFGSENDAYGDPISSPIVVGSGGEKRVMLYTELRGLAGETISHRWERDGQTMAVVPFRVRGDRWRVHSSKRLTPALRGSWKVIVTDSRGVTLASRSFLVQ